ncbi:MAG: AAA domain-containing protein [Nitrospirota bacterium]
MSDKLKDKTYRLFEYISQVYSIDLPVVRDVTKYEAELWWQADIIVSSQCQIKEFSEGNIEADTAPIGNIGESAWLSVTKRSYDNPPELPSILREWVILSTNPSKLPNTNPSILKLEVFDSDPQRVTAFKGYVGLFTKWYESKIGDKPLLPEVLAGWVDETQLIGQLPVFINTREVEERFEDNKNRVIALNNYIKDQWKIWSEKVYPLYKANILYDQFFNLHQRFSVEGDRIEIIWGHLFLTWNHGPGVNIYHPLIITPMNLHFDPMRRNISLIPSQTIPMRMDLECLANLDYPFKDELITYSRIVNNSETPPDAWDHSQMRGIAATFTGYISKESAEKTNLYSDKPIARPSYLEHPAMYNAPSIFVRERTRRLWIEDAKKVAEAIYNGSEIPPFIRSLTADPKTNELPSPEDYVDEIKIDEDDGENLLPLLYNDQQEDIVKKLKNHFGVLVQGPPGTGKSHTIANIVSSLLARGKRVLVTSQTENALKVLRDYIPEEIRSLCVSQLGSDTESKRQLNDAVESIGKHLAEKNSRIVDQKIQQLKNDLRRTREEQARLLNQIKDWVELDSCTMKIDGAVITAHQAAKGCSEGQENYSWFPDAISPETEPPLVQQELIEMCSLVKEISPGDRKSCLQYLPDPRLILTPNAFSKEVTDLRALTNLAAETEDLKSEWDNQLDQASRIELESAISLLEEALSDFRHITESWQFKILDLIVSEKAQADYWQIFVQKCKSLRDSAWTASQIIQSCEITPEDFPTDLDVVAALEELERAIARGKKPSSWITRLSLSKAARAIYDLVKIDGSYINTVERVNAVKAQFSYKSALKKIDTAWGKTIAAVDGAGLNLAVSMPLAEIDEKIKSVCCPIDWKNKHYEKFVAALTALGCKEGLFHKQEVLENCFKVLRGQVAEIERQAILQNLSEYRQALLNEASKEGAHDLWVLLSDAVEEQSDDKYAQTYNELMRLLQISKKVERLEYLSKSLKNIAPIWYGTLEKKAIESGPEALEKDWATAWRWKRLDKWLHDLHGRESVESLQQRSERSRKKERELLVHLVKERTWQRQIANVEDHHYRALVAWADAMRRYGKTGGKYPLRWLNAAAKAMVDAVNAVPAWIMPLHRVIQSFQAEPGIFDVIIVDEASQCDLRALPVLFRAKKVLVVGDPEQISPSQVGIDENKIFELNRQFLSDIPYAETTFLIKNSLYDISKSVPRTDRTLLTEHFRCVPQIIEFNNHLCPSYAEKLEPLRQPNPQEMLDPPINTIFVENGFKDGNDINKPEAEALIEMLVECCNCKEYSQGGKNNRKRTMGVISLLGEKQAKYISDLIAERLDETEREERRIICGDAYAFQGDERDVMFLSLVIASNAQFSAMVKDADRQRFNVATSRARDQVFLFHSVRLSDIRNTECVRYKLMNWYTNPPVAEIEAGIEILKQKADSPFEIEVGERIIKRGYKVIPQFKPFPNDYNYRIDLVIQGENNRVAVECDGDRYHGIEKWEYDQRREAQLRRAGWKFWRISGSAFYRDKAKALEGLWQFLDEEGINKVTDWKGKTTEGKREAPFTEQEEKATMHFPGDTLSSQSYQPPVDEAENVATKTEPVISADTLQAQEVLFRELKIPQVSTNPGIWFDISKWIMSTTSIYPGWANFAVEIGNALKNRKPLTQKQRNNMGKLWKLVIKKGFKSNSWR